MLLRHPRFRLNRFEDEIGCVELAVRMRIRYAYYVSLVLEYQNVVDPFSTAQFDILLLPHAEQIFYLGYAELGECQVVTRAVANDPRNPSRRRAPEYPNGCLELLRR